MSERERERERCILVERLVDDVIDCSLSRDLRRLLSILSEVIR